jgi:hypothetical protein
MVDSMATSTSNSTRPDTGRRDRPRVMQRILALAAAIWHNDHTGQPVLRSLTAYDD